MISGFDARYATSGWKKAPTFRSGRARRVTGLLICWRTISGQRASFTGHTADDVAETVLMNLARGAGLRGLAGIPPVRGRISRPLIRQTREDILEYLEHLEQPYRSDPTNLAGDYARNRIRLEVLPVLEELYPGARKNAARAASIAHEDLAALENLASNALHRRGDEIVLTSDGPASLPQALRRHAVRQAYATLAPDAAGPGPARGRSGPQGYKPAGKGRGRWTCPRASWRPPATPESWRSTSRDKKKAASSFVGAG